MKHRIKLISIFLATLLSITLYSFISHSQNNQKSNGINSSLIVKKNNNPKLDELIKDVISRVKKDYVEEKTDTEIAKSAVQGILSSLDPHSAYLDEDDFKEMQVQTRGEFGGVGVEITVENSLIKVITALDDTPAKKAGIQNGDFISKIDGKLVVGMTLEEVVKRMRGKPNTKVNLTILRAGEKGPLNFIINRKIIKLSAVKSELYEDIAYIRISSFSEKTTKSVVKSVKTLARRLKKDKKDLKGLIIDLRNNPGGLLDQSIGVSDLFLKNNEDIVSIKGRSAKSERIYKDSKKEELIPGKPIIVLINEGSASASEIVAGALQDNKRALIMGKKSFGKGSVQSVIYLGDKKGAVKMTTALYYTPSGKSIQAHGIEPDIIVEDGKLEITEKDADNLRSEASLDHHLKRQIKNAVNESKRDQLEDSNTDLYNTDYQLARAIDLLRGIGVYKNLIK